MIIRLRLSPTETRYVNTNYIVHFKRHERCGFNGADGSFVQMTANNGEDMWFTTMETPEEILAKMERV